MAVRPVYYVSDDKNLFIKEDVEFKYFNGFAVSQKKKCIQSLHQSFLAEHPEANILEISTTSEQSIGVELSAFNLSITNIKGEKFSVESAFQAGKIFENGGPYMELLRISSRDAKKDPRLRDSGKLIAFQFDNITFETEPKTYFYNWLYITALCQHKELAKDVLAYDAFTDISFNPQKSINCQAEAAAIYVSLERQGLLEDALKDKENFKKIVYGDSK